MSRGRMTMRAAVERDGATGADDWGGAPAPGFAALGTYPCFVWARSARHVADGRKDAAVEEWRAMFPLGTDIREGDEIAGVTDRRGNEIIAGRFRIGTPLRKARHVEAALEKVS